MGKRITLKNVSIAFVDRLFVPKGSEQNPDRKTYGFNVLLDPKSNSDAVQAVNEAIDEVAKEAWGKDAKGYHRCLRDNAEEGKNYYPDDALFMSANSGDRVATVDRRGVSVTEEEAKAQDILHSGSIVNIVLELYATDKGGRKICCAPSGVQYVAEGTRHGGRSLSDRAGDFDALEDDGSGEELL